jgi:hypothetical protein
MDRRCFVQPGRARILWRLDVERQLARRRAKAIRASRSMTT